MDEGPFFHGTKAALRVGDLLTPGFRSNYRADVVMNHVYFTALRDGAGSRPSSPPATASRASTSWSRRAPSRTTRT